MLLVVGCLLVLLAFSFAFRFVLKSGGLKFKFTKLESNCERYASATQAQPRARGVEEKFYMY